MRQSTVPLMLAVLLLGGCSSASPSSSATGAGGDPREGAHLSDVSAAQAEEIEDRVATADEYALAFQRYRDCLSAAGFELVDLKYTNLVYEFGVPGAAVDSGVDEECYNSEFRYVDILWQSTDEVANRSDTARFFRDCLEMHDIDPADSLVEMNEQLRTAGIEPPDCLSDVHDAPDQ